jgi:hypothetical protein
MPASLRYTYEQFATAGPRAMQDQCIEIRMTTSAGISSLDSLADIDTICVANS